MEPNLDHAAIHEFIFEWLVDKLPASDLRITPRDPIIFYSCSNTVLRLLSKFFSCFSHFLLLVPRLSMSLAGRLSMFQVMGPRSEATLWSLAHRPGWHFDRFCVCMVPSCDTKLEEIWLIRSISTKFPPNSSSLQFQWSVEAFPCHLPMSTKVLRSNPRPEGGEAAGYSSCGTKSCSRRPKVQMFCQEEVEPGPWLAEHIVLFFFQKILGRRLWMEAINVISICIPFLFESLAGVYLHGFSPFCWWNMVKASNFLWRLNGHLVAPIGLGITTETGGAGSGIWRRIHWRLMELGICFDYLFIYLFIYLFTVTCSASRKQHLHRPRKKIVIV